MVDYVKLRDKAIKILSEKNDVMLEQIEFYAWPEIFSSTAGPCGAGGQAMTKVTVFCWVNTYVMDCVLYTCEKWKYKKIFVPFISWNDKREKQELNFCYACGRIC